ncbi:MAG: NUDIX hydrolase [Chitinophagales bacterium]
MRLPQISCKIKQSIAQLRKGFAAQRKMSPPFREKLVREMLDKQTPKEAGVLILLYENDEEMYIAFTQRHTYKGVHSGQISLPGGKAETVDIDFAATAIRETEEEIGVLQSDIALLGELTELYVPPSNFMIYPFVGAYYDGKPDFVKEEAEVAEILEIKLSDLLDEKNIQEYKLERRDFTYKTPAYFINGKIIWGATAMILSEFLDVVKNLQSMRQ